MDLKETKEISNKMQHEEKSSNSGLKVHSGVHAGACGFYIMSDGSSCVACDGEIIGCYPPGYIDQYAQK